MNHIPLSYILGNKRLTLKYVPIYGTHTEIQATLDIKYIYKLAKDNQSNHHN